jgi:heat shock protein HslJ
MKKLMLVSLIMLIILVSACSTGQSSLPGTAWQLATLGGSPVIAGAAPTLSFGTDGSISGWDGCNHFSGTYTASGSSLSIKIGPSTLMACPEDIMKQAEGFTQGLINTASYKMDKANLTLKDAQGADLMGFAVIVPASLTGGTWSATGVNNGKQAVSSLVAGTTITATFGSDGTLTGKDGCNSYNTTYKVDGNKIAIQPAATTKMACPDDVMAQENNYLNALTNAKVYSISNGELELRDDSGALQVSFMLQ